jgi:glycosyltransferase involved in cell wall biosynthesis
VLEDYGDYDNVVISCNEENMGLLRSRNLGAELASGDVIAFIDDNAIERIIGLSDWSGHIKRRM